MGHFAALRTEGSNPSLSARLQNVHTGHKGNTFGANEFSPTSSTLSIFLYHSIAPRPFPNCTNWFLQGFTAVGTPLSRLLSR